MLAPFSVTEVTERVGNNGSLHYFLLHCTGLLFHQCPGEKSLVKCVQNLFPTWDSCQQYSWQELAFPFDWGEWGGTAWLGHFLHVSLRCHPIMGTCITFPSESTKSLTRSGRSLGVTLMPLRTTCTCQSTSTNNGLAALTFSLPAQPSVGATTTAREISGFQWKIIKNVQRLSCSS